MHFDDREERAFQLVSEFFHAVAKVYGSAWYGMAPRFSRLRHGAGIVAMGFVMDHLYTLEGATERDQFEPGLRLLAQTSIGRPKVRRDLGAPRPMVLRQESNIYR